MQPCFEIYLVAVPGLEAPLCDEARACGFATAKIVPGGVSLEGDWSDVRRANMNLRGASRVLARIGSFHAAHLAQLDKRARAFAWGSILRRDVPVRIEATCRKSRIYHSGAAAERIATAIREEFGAPIDRAAEVTIMARIENDLVTLSVDTSGGLLHKRGHKEAIAKAPMRETMAALFLRQCGFTGRETVIDPMCGSGTFVNEAAEMALGLAPGRDRSFAFEKLAIKLPPVKDVPKSIITPLEAKFYGFDRDAGAITAATANAARSGVSGVTTFRKQPISELAPPEGAPGLIICNPPYGTRIGDKKPLFDLYSAFGRVLRERFQGWRVGFVTSDAKLARATGLTLNAGKPVLHGGLRVVLYQATLPT